MSTRALVERKPSDFVEYNYRRIVLRSRGHRRRRKYYAGTVQRARCLCRNTPPRPEIRRRRPVLVSRRSFVKNRPDVARAVEINNGNGPRDTRPRNNTRRK